MNFQSLVNGLLQETTQISVRLFAPELVVCGTILAILLVRLLSADRWFSPHYVAMLGAIVALLCTADQYLELGSQQFDSYQFFTGMLIFDKFTLFFRLLLLLSLVLMIALTMLSGIPDNEDGPDFFTLLLGATVGMMVMASSNHLLMLFLGVEMASVPSYALVGFLKGRRESSEAALKYVIYGAGAAGVMLYGISLIAGLTGTGDFGVLAARLGEIVTNPAGITDPVSLTLVLGVLMVLVGLAFKLSIVPFHFWCPDVFEGAAAEVAGYLSVASKAAAFALLVRFSLAVVGGVSVALQPLSLALGVGIGLIAVVTATFGNLAAYAQTNVKRLLAYSTIAHAGVMLMAVSAMLVMLNAPETIGWSANEVAENAARCVNGLLYYLTVYLFMNLGAFAIVVMIRNQIFSEELDDYRGLIHHSPTLCVCMLICVFSLIGMPPFGGFFAKLSVFAAVFQATDVHWSMWVVLLVGVLNTVFSLYYYLRILKTMFFDERPDGARSVYLPFASWAGGYVAVLSLAVVALGLWVQRLSDTTYDVAIALFR